MVKPGRGVCALGLVRLAAVFEAVALTVHFEDAGIDPSVGSVGGPYDNALAETLNGLYKADVIHRLGPWKNSGRCRTENPQMGRLAQQPSPACTPRIHPTIRG